VSAALPVLVRPPWIKARAPQGEGYERLRGLMRGLDLHTVCEEAHCPNLGECWARGTATFMILGDVCTRACGFLRGQDGPARSTPEPRPGGWRKQLPHGPRHAVITSVNRDDRKDGGARRVRRRIRAAIRERVPGCAVEVLIPDFRGDEAALRTVIDARPDVLNHNTETVPRLYRQVRPGARFERSLELLRRSSAAGLTTKSGIMVGLGETWDEILETVRAIRDAGAHVLTVGQYLRPSADHLPVMRYYTPDEFAEIKREALALGYGHVESGPLVRSSYHADEQVPSR
jgi:lipoic acid synthetase